jgi:hypothetical protein
VRLRKELIRRLVDYRNALVVLLAVGVVSAVGTQTALKDLSTNVLATVLMLFLGVLVLDDLVEGTRRQRLRRLDEFLRNQIARTIDEWGRLAGEILELPHGTIVPAGATGPQWVLDHLHLPVCHTPQHMNSARILTRDLWQDYAHLQLRWLDYAPSSTIEEMVSFEIALVDTLEWIKTMIILMNQKQTPSTADDDRGRVVLRRGAEAALALHGRFN